ERGHSVAHLVDLGQAVVTAGNGSEFVQRHVERDNVGLALDFTQVVGPKVRRVDLQRGRHADCGWSPLSEPVDRPVAERGDCLDYPVAGIRHAAGQFPQVADAGSAHRAHDTGIPYRDFERDIGGHGASPLVPSFAEFVAVNARIRAMKSAASMITAHGRPFGRCHPVAKSPGFLSARACSSAGYSLSASHRFTSMCTPSRPTTSGESGPPAYCTP